MSVRRRIEENPCWLLVLDNADDLAAFGVGLRQSEAEPKQSLYDFVPRGPGGTLLWTSRDRRIGGSLVSTKQAINVTCMTDGEARMLLEMVMGKGVGKELQTVLDLLIELDYLPLAVSQAAAYIRRTSTSIPKYLLKLRERKQRWDVLFKTEFDRHRRNHVANDALRTWDISIEQIGQESRMAYNILHMLSFLDNQNIPVELIAKGAELMRSADDSLSVVPTCSTQERPEEDKDAVRTAIVLLQDFSFLRVRALDGLDDAYEMHKFVQEATQYSLSQPARRKDEEHFSGVALRAVADLFPETIREHWQECEKYLAHVKSAAKWAPLCAGEVAAASLLTVVSNYLGDHGRWREKEPVDETAYEYRVRTLGVQHSDTLESMALLAGTYHSKGKYDLAEKMKLDVLARRREVLGDQHPNTLESVASLAETYHSQVRYDEAEKMQVDILARRRELIGDQHPDTITSMASLATTYYSQERYVMAEKLEEHVIRLRCDVLGKKHPQTIVSMASLPITHYIQGKFKSAEKMLMDVLELQREVLGEGHIFTISSMGSLASTYYGQGRFDEAEKMADSVLALRRKALGEKHPQTIMTMSLLGRIYYAQKRYDIAEKMVADALTLRQEVLPKNHFYTIRGMEYLAAIHHTQGRYDEAERMQVDVLQLDREILGPKNLWTIRSTASLARTYSSLGRYDVAEKMQADVLDLKREVLGNKHRETTFAMQNLAVTWWNSRQRPRDAVSLMRECYYVQREVLGEEHPTTKVSLQTLAQWGKADRNADFSISRAFTSLAHHVKARLPW